MLTVQSLASEIQKKRRQPTTGFVRHPGAETPNPAKSNLEYFQRGVWGGIPYNYYIRRSAVTNTPDNHRSHVPGNAHVNDKLDARQTPVPGRWPCSDVPGARPLKHLPDLRVVFVRRTQATTNASGPVSGAGRKNSPGYVYQQIGPLGSRHFFTSASIRAFYGFGNANYFDATDLLSVNQNAIASSLQHVQEDVENAIPNAGSRSRQWPPYYGLPKNVCLRRRPPRSRFPIRPPDGPTP